MAEMTVSLSPATSEVLRKMYVEAKERGDETAKYSKSPEAFAENLFDFAINRKHGEWKARDKQRVGRDLQVALDKLLSGKPLSSEEQKIVATFQEAAAKK